MFVFKFFTNNQEDTLLLTFEIVKSILEQWNAFKTKFKIKISTILINNLKTLLLILLKNTVPLGYT